MVEPAASSETFEDIKNECNAKVSLAVKETELVGFKTEIEKALSFHYQALEKALNFKVFNS